MQPTEGNVKTSARNQFQGAIAAITKGAVNSEVTLKAAGGAEIVSIITNESVERLGLAVGKPAYALIKATWIVIGKNLDQAKLSTRNVLCGTVETVHDGAVNAEIILKLSGGETITAILTETSAHALGLAAGEPACAAFKASHVILAVD